MAWYENSVFYHIYPLGLCDAPKKNDYQVTEHRLKKVLPWILHIKEIGCNAIYIGPLFSSVGHGYETTDYKKLDERLGTNEDLKEFVLECHKNEIHVIFDGVFNHVGRDFFAFQDLLKNRENSPYRDWFCNVNFYGNNEYNDGFSYDNWGGYNLLVKLNHQNPKVREYMIDAVDYWIKEFDVDGIRLDAADVLDFIFMQDLRRFTDQAKPEFWLMGEVIHGDYTRWVNQEVLHSVTNYQLHKALYSGHNDHNYFEIAHTIRRFAELGRERANVFYNFVDNHDVERIQTKLVHKQHFHPVHTLLFTLPGIPSIYYGSEFAIEGKKEKFSDDSLRPALHIEDYKDALKTNPATALICILANAHQQVKALYAGDYKELMLTNRQYAFARHFEDSTAIIAVNCDDHEANFSLSVQAGKEYTDVISGRKVTCDGQLKFSLGANSSAVWVMDSEVPLVERINETVANTVEIEPETTPEPKIKVENSEITEPEVEVCVSEKMIVEDQIVESEVVEPEVEGADITEESKEIKSSPVEIPKNLSYEEMSVEQLQQCILEKMAANGPVTEQMKKEVRDNVYHNSLLNWVKSFR